MKYAFFPGCVLESAAKEDYLATVAVAKKLGIELEELDGWTCCGASHVQDIAPEITLATNARNIALAEEKGLNLLTVCNTCTLMLREAKNELDNNEKEKNEVNKKLAQIGKQYRGTTDITHFLWVLIRDYGLDKLKAKVVKPLTGLRVAEYYGCHILRPQTELGFEDYQMPTSLADLISAIGATPIDFSRKLDWFQKEAKEVVGGGKDMPILHMSQLVGLALGISPEEMGMPKRHLTDTAAVTKFVG